MSDIVLHGYWRSSAAYRVRIALALKNVAYRQENHDLRTGAQHAPGYRVIAPHGLVPAIEAEGMTLIESPAILEWIEQRWPSPPLLPSAAQDASSVRAMAALVACDIHPLNNLRVLNALRSEFGASDMQVEQWIHRWIGDGFAALEALVSKYGAGYAFGDAPTLADCYLVPQLYNAERFGADLSPFPSIVSAGNVARAHPAFQIAHPDAQSDACPS